ncbi:hypothetical protein O6H91_09G073300 [Diphasiastrum complanatum]|uniref:Uncharacterized protein n=4 Tax=Diphasiastrum complanatum TaxID=34168 RepID=A0ACC2CQP1_DIPCM|nr:hypothetical protein O6H91_09G073300 [Diphasiastrum complanatum]KAJ7544305.1 hypothetical protein O6H91_09G073300 [Diphasiastrum complanatum]KAJ7544306.1 hypothetical protein O6H91_09G073300 [Diphasiastrum complanatum]KAJ7544307.1 hypothetical protein O6H91_09G073300 [Diphasiastrum complanatum]
MSSINMVQEGFSGIGGPGLMSEDEEFLCPRMKFLCSYGGKILPRPSDGKLRYVGGETRIIAVNRDISYSELMSKMMDLYGQILTLKYQLPDEDLDALVSVSSNEDLENMVDEYDRLETGEFCSKLRVFLFSTVEQDVLYTAESGKRKYLEQLYLDAINGVTDACLKKHMDSAAAIASEPLENLIGFDFMDCSYPPSSVVSQQTTFKHSLQVPSSFRGPSASLPEFSPACNPQIAFYFDDPDSSDPNMPSQENVSNTGGQELIEFGSDQTSRGLAQRASNLQPNYDQNSKVLQLPHSFTQNLSDPLPSGSYEDPFLQSEQDFANEVANLKSVGPQSSRQIRGLISGSDSGNVPLSFFKRESDFLPSGIHQESLLASAEQCFLGEGSIPRAYSEQAMQLLETHIAKTLSECIGCNPESQNSTAVLRSPLNLHLSALQQQQQHSIWQQSAKSQVPATTQFEPQMQASESLHPKFATGQRQVEMEQQRESESNATIIKDCVSSHSVNPSTSSELVSVPPYLGDVPSLSNLSGSDLYGRNFGLSQVKTKQEIYRAFPKEQQNYRTSDFPVEQSFLPPSPKIHLFGTCDEQVLQLEQKPCFGTQISFQDDAARNSQCTNDGSCIPYVQNHNDMVGPMVPPFFVHGQIYDGISLYPEYRHGADWRNQDVQQGTEVAGDMEYQHKYINPDNVYQNAFTQPSDFVLRPWQLEKQENPNGYLLKDQYETDNGQLQTISGGRFGRVDFNNQESSQGSKFVNRMQAVRGSHLKVTFSKELAVPSASTLEDAYLKGQKEIGNVLVHGRVKPPLLQQTAGNLELRQPDATLTAMDNPVDSKYPGSNGCIPIEILTAPRLTIHDATMLSSLERLKEQITYDGDSLSPCGNQSPVEEGIASRLPGYVVQNKLETFEDRFESQEAVGISTVTTNEKIIESPANLVRNHPKDFQVPDPDRRISSPTQKSSTSIDNKSSQAICAAYKYSVGVQVNQSSLDDEETYKVAFDNVCNASNTGSSSISMPSQVAINVANNLLAITSNAQNSANLDPNVQKDFVALDILPYDAQCLPNFADTNKSQPFLTCYTDELVSTEIDTFEKPASPSSADNTKSVDEIIASGNLVQNAHANVVDLDTINEPMRDIYIQDHAEIKSKEERKLCGEDASLILFHGITSPSSSQTVQCKKNLLGHKQPKEITVDEKSVAQNVLELDKAKPRLAKNVLFKEHLCSFATVAKDAETGSNSESTASVAEAEAIARGLQTIKNADLEELQELGSGTFGTVYHGKWRGSDVAIKRIKSSCFNKRPAERERLIADFWREACMLSQLHHPNVVAFYGVVPDGPDGTLATVTEFMINGSLKQVLQRKDRTIDRRRRLLIAMDAAFGMEYLHEKKIVHFDLKCENLLVNMRDPHRPVCKVGDLGLSKIKRQTMVSGGVRGTLPWMAPELLNGRSSLVSEKVDVFSFGIVMWELLTGEEPYAELHYGAIIGGIVHNSLRPAIPDWCDPMWRSLMERCWSNEPSDRPSFSEINSELQAMAASQNSKAQRQTQAQVRGNLVVQAQV